MFVCGKYNLKSDYMYFISSSSSKARKPGNGLLIAVSLNIICSYNFDNSVFKESTGNSPIPLITSESWDLNLSFEILGGPAK